MMRHQWFWSEAVLDFNHDQQMKWQKHLLKLYYGFIFNDIKTKHECWSSYFNRDTNLPVSTYWILFLWNLSINPMKDPFECIPVHDDDDDV